MSDQIQGAGPERETPGAGSEKAAGTGKQPAARRTLRRRLNDALLKFAGAMQRAENDSAIVELRRADRRVPRRVLFNAIGQMLYRVGQQTEYLFVLLMRFVHRFVHWIVFGVMLFGRAGLTAAHRFLLGLQHDFVEPVVRLAVGLSHARQAVQMAREEGEERPKAAGIAYVKRGVRIYHRLIFSALSYLLPVAAAAAFLFTVHSVVSTEYSLSVTYEGTFLGYVANETVWENAQQLIKSRIIAADSDEEWSALPTFKLASVNTAARSDASTIANRLIETSSEKIQEATGIYVDGTLMGVCTETYNDLNTLLTQRLEAAAAAGGDGARAEFVREITLVPGIYFTSSIGDFSAINTAMEQSGLYQTKLIRTETYTETIEYNTIEQETDELYKGSQRTVQRGINGEKEVTADIVTVDGVVVETRILSETVTTPAQDKIVEIGTKERPGYVEFSGQVGSGVLSFPVPNYSYITTQFGQGGHRGTDICAPAGTPIYACDSGTVIEAGWHSSWGNYVLIDHGNGMTTRYAHCSSLLVGAGTNVARGQLIATVGSTGYSSGPHCHLEVTVNGSLTNPMNYF